MNPGDLEADPSALVEDGPGGGAETAAGDGALGRAMTDSATPLAPDLEADSLRAGSALEDAPSRTSVLAWFRVVGGAVVFALALRVLAFEAYRIPSTSMEDTLLVGDFVLVSKLHYGARVLGRRAPGATEPQRGDVVVFNYPPSLDPDVTRRIPYIKRVVGTPGDTLSIRGKTVQVGANAQSSPPSGRSLWSVRGRLPRADALDSLGLTRRLRRVDDGAWIASATSRQAQALAGSGDLEVAPYVRPAGDGSAAFPSARRYSLDDYGPVVVPAKGQTVVLDDASWSLVRTAIERFEGHTVERTAMGFLIDGRPAETYTFTQDYYFVMGDSRDDSADSRTWGFVPFDHVIGKAVVVYFSWDDDSERPRWDRVGSGMDE